MSGKREREALKEIVAVAEAGWIAADWPEAKEDTVASAEQIMIKRIKNIAAVALR